MNKYILIVALLFMTNVSFGAAPSCHNHSSGNYCQYNGKVRQIYINASNTIIIYFDTAVDISVPQSFGFNVTTGRAAALKITDSNSIFAHLFYSTALAAKMADKEITMQMKSLEGGYLKFDRIWLK
jgi:hypothetical protein